MPLGIGADLVRVVPLPSVHSIWSERWDAIESRLFKLEGILKESGAAVARGGNFDTWDLSIRGGLFGTVRLLAAVEEHGEGRQLCRFRTWPKSPVASVTAVLTLLILGSLAALDHAFIAAAFLSLTAGGLALLIYADCAIAMQQWSHSLEMYLLQDGTAQMLTRSNLKETVLSE